MKVGKPSLCMMINPYQQKHVVKLVFPTYFTMVAKEFLLVPSLETNSSHLNHDLAFCKMENLLLKGELVSFRECLYIHS